MCSPTSKSESAARRRSCRARCQVSGCSADLSLAKVYSQRRHLCEAHMQADSVLLEGGSSHLYRFCFQCGKLQELECFDGIKRTCRLRLQKRRESSSSKKHTAPCNLQPEAVSSDGNNCCSTLLSQADCTRLVLSASSADGSVTDLTLPATAGCGEGSSCAGLPEVVISAGTCSINSSIGSQSTSWDAAVSGTAVFGCAPCAEVAPVQWPAVAHAAAATASPTESCDPLLCQHSLESITDAASLELMLETELAAAALQVALAAGSSQPLDPDSQETSRMLAAAIVADSGLFDDPPMDTTSLALLSQQSSNMASSMPTACAGSPATLTTPNTVPATATAAAGPWAACGLMNGPILGDCAGLPCSSEAAAAGYPCWHGPAAGAGCVGGATPSIVPCSAAATMDVAPMLEAYSVMHGCMPGVPQVTRLELLRQQMAQLQSRVELLRHQLAL